MTNQPFSSSIVKQLGYYVYLYINPLDDEIFYVGKGKGNRAFEHLKPKITSQVSSIIKKIQKAGEEPRIEILAHGLPDESAAYKIESAVIDVLGLDNLANTVRGRHSEYYGRMGIEQIAALYAPRPIEIAEPSMLIKLTWSYHYGIDQTELYDGTRGIWKVGKRREKVKFAFATYDGIIQEVYEIVQWFPAGTTFSSRGDQKERRRYKDRWEFVGRLAPDKVRDQYLFKSVRRYWKNNPRIPIVYVNC